MTLPLRFCIHAALYLLTLCLPFPAGMFFSCEHACMVFCKPHLYLPVGILLLCMALPQTVVAVATTTTFFLYTRRRLCLSLLQHNLTISAFTTIALYHYYAAFCHA